MKSLEQWFEEERRQAVEEALEMMRQRELLTDVLEWLRRAAQSRGDTKMANVLSVAIDLSRESE